MQSPTRRLVEEQFNHFGEEASALLTDVMNECNRTNARGEPLILKPGHKMANRFETCINGGWIIFDLLPKNKRTIAAMRSARFVYG